MEPIIKAAKECTCKLASLCSVRSVGCCTNSRQQHRPPSFGLSHFAHRCPNKFRTKLHGGRKAIEPGGSSWVSEWILHKTRARLHMFRFALIKLHEGSWGLRERHILLICHVSSTQAVPMQNGSNKSGHEWNYIHAMHTSHLKSWLQFLYLPLSEGIFSAEIRTVVTIMILTSFQSAYGRREEFYLFASVMEATMLDKRLSDKSLQLELTVGNAGNSLDGQGPNSMEFQHTFQQDVQQSF